MLANIIEVILDDSPNDGLCECIWDDISCTSRASWHVVNTTNAGHAYMCNEHKSRFQAFNPGALVKYIPMGE